MAGVLRLEEPMASFTPMARSFSSTGVTPGRMSFGVRVDRLSRYSSFFMEAISSFSSSVYVFSARSRIMARLSMRLTPRRRLLISWSK